ncbi:MAG: hypothetical protein JST67_08480 [Bacteroidetes bacterium]|nr:hypothetical protein [Bacteroidota bacterium]
MAEKKQFTAKDISVSDIELFNEIKRKTGFTPAKLFSELLKTQVNQVNPEVTNRLQKQNEGLLKENQELKTVNQQFTEKIQALEKKITENTEVYEGKLKDLQEVNQKLNQYYHLDFNPSLNDGLKKLRRMLKEKNKIPKESTEEEFINRICSEALVYYFKNKHEYIKI